MRVPAGFQNWRRLLFVHWRLDISDVRHLVPECLEVDTFDGSAFVGLVLFAVEAARPLGAPPALGLKFLETNVRTYVRTRDGRPGVFFFSLDAASLLAVVGARLTLGLPYFWAGGRECVDGGTIGYTLRRRAGPGVHVRYRVGADLGVATHGTLEHFLIERYRLHHPRGPSLWTVQVAHRPYPLQQVRLEALQDDLVREAGIQVTGVAPLVHFARGVDVEVFAPNIRRLQSLR
jgi:uncharacterized protein YqjF (DUF2071 family)